MGFKTGFEKVSRNIQTKGENLLTRKETFINVMDL